MFKWSAARQVRAQRGRTLLFCLFVFYFAEGVSACTAHNAQVDALSPFERECKKLLGNEVAPFWDPVPDFRNEQTDGPTGCRTR